MYNARGNIVGTSISLLTASRVRFAATVAGISLCILLMVFLAGVYRGVSDGSVEFVRSSHADVWVVQKNVTNILRGFSLLTTAHGTLIRELPGVRTVSPILFKLETIRTPAGLATVYLTGHDPSSGLGHPPEIFRGRTIRTRREIVLDRAFARRWSCDVGDTVRIADAPFVVTGISGGSNMFVIQYAFTHINDVRELFGMNELVSVYLVELDGTSEPSALTSLAEVEVPGISAYTQDVFLRQNIREMENGFLPIVLVMMTISALLLTVIIGLLLTMSVLEHRGEFAVLKAIGAPRRYLPTLVFFQSTQLVGSAVCVAAAFVLPLAEAVQHAAPEVSIAFSLQDVFTLVLILMLLIVAGAVFPLLRLRGIYPVEAFR